MRRKICHTYKHTTRKTQHTTRQEHHHTRDRTKNHRPALNNDRRWRGDGADSEVGQPTICPACPLLPCPLLYVKQSTGHTHTGHTDRENTPDNGTHTRTTRPPMYVMVRVGVDGCREDKRSRSQLSSKPKHDRRESLFCRDRRATINKTMA